MPPPSPGAFTAGFCERFGGALPGTLGALERRDVSPSRPGLAAYGDPAVVIRCGVAPAARPPGDNSQVTVGAVTWYPEQRGGEVVWTTIDSPVPVEVTVPKAHDGQLIARLADPIREAAG